MLPDLSGECVLKATRSGGKGGQHVNKVSTRIELTFDIPASRLLTDEQKLILQEKLATRLSSTGELRITEDSARSQHENREKVFKKLYALLEKALTPVKKRKKTRVPAGVKAKRLESKKKKSEKKQLRKKDY